MVDQIPISDTNRRNGRRAWLAPEAAASYERMKAAGMPGGCVSDAGRTFAEQTELYEMYLRGELKATAARPGTSKHETGRALDLAEPARTWVRTHGDPHGWLKDNVRNEPWHQEYLQGQDAEEDEDDMATLTDENLREISLAVWGQKLGRTDVSMHDAVSMMQARVREMAETLAELQAQVDRLARGPARPAAARAPRKTSDPATHAKGATRRRRAAPPG